MLDPIVAFFQRIFAAIGRGIGLAVSWLVWPFVAAASWYRQHTATVRLAASRKTPPERGLFIGAGPAARRALLLCDRLAMGGGDLRRAEGDAAKAREEREAVEAELRKTGEKRSAIEDQLA